MSYDAPPPSPYGAPPPAQRTSSAAVVSLVCGILGLLCLGIILGPVAIVTGRKAQRETGSGGLGRAGEILGYIDLVFFVIGIIYVANR